VKYRLFVSKIPPGESTWEWQVGPELFEAIGATYGIQDLAVRVWIQARREARYLRLHFRLEGWVVVTCDRGLEPIQLPIQSQHEQVYSWDEHYLPPEEVEEFFTLGPREDLLDLTQSFYDYIGLAIPLRRVRPTCPDDQCPAHIKAFFSDNPSE